MEENKIESIKSEFSREYPEFVSFLQSYGKPIITAVLIAVTVTLGFRLFSARKDADVAEAASALVEAKSITDLEAIITDYASTPAAPIAYLSLAKAYFDSADYDMALSNYMDFLSKFPEHPMADAAKLNRTACLEARGQVQEALAGYEEFAENNPDHYLKNEALFGKARCLETQGRLEQAKAVYEDYIVDNPRGAWFPRAEEALDQLDKKLEARPAAGEKG